MQFSRTRWRRAFRSPDGIILSVLLMLCATVPLYVITKYTNATLWSYRYMCSMSFAFAFLHAGILYSYTSTRARCFGIFCLGLIVFPTVFSFAHLWPQKSSVDYSAVARTIARERSTSGTVVFMTSEFVEGWTSTFPATEFDQGWLLAPFTFYPTGGTVRLVPHELSQAPESYFNDIRAVVGSSRRIVYFGPDLPDWLAESMGARFSRRSLGKERVFIVFERKG
jgi:hypothetical protein